MTTIDYYIEGSDAVVCVEVKWSEAGIGRCSCRGEGIARAPVEEQQAAVDACRQLDLEWELWNETDGLRWRARNKHVLGGLSPADQRALETGWTDAFPD